jgi:hypothetical protein
MLHWYAQICGIEDISPVDGIHVHVKCLAFVIIVKDSIEKNCGSKERNVSDVTLLPVIHQIYFIPSFVLNCLDYLPQYHGCIPLHLEVLSHAAALGDKFVSPLQQVWARCWV